MPTVETRDLRVSEIQQWQRVGMVRKGRGQGFACTRSVSRRVTNVEVPNRRRTRSPELIGHRNALSLSRLKGSQKRMQCGVGMPANAILFLPMAIVKGNQTRRHQHVQRTCFNFPSTPYASDVFRNISLSLMTGWEKMAFYKFCRKKKIGIGWSPKTMRNS